jgi:hypothetical protein
LLAVEVAGLATPILKVVEVAVLEVLEQVRHSL